jgi:hypothetical protein
MVLFVPRNPETLADRARYTTEGLTTVSCLDCLVSVQVRKNSDKQTAIQWSAEAQKKCPELSSRPTIHEGCPRLKASIEAAVRDGLLPVGVPE